MGLFSLATPGKPLKREVELTGPNPVRAARWRLTGLAALLASWWLAFWARGISYAWFPFDWDNSPRLPWVPAVPWSNEGDFFSATSHLFGGLFLAILVGALVELTKYSSLKAGNRRSYVLAFLYQVTVMAETFICSAPDWAAHALSLLFFRGEREVTLSVSWVRPWASLVPLAIALADEVVRFRTIKRAERTAVTSE